jgi:acyl-CoA thioesterase-1
MAARVAREQPIKIVALGSSSTAGVGASTDDATYPSRLEAELRRILPRNKVAIVNKGVSGEDSRQMVARFQRDVIDERPDLVIWQTGTNSAIRRGDLNAFSRDLREGLRLARAAGIDVMFMTPQHSPKFDAMPDHRAFIDQIDLAARQAGAPVIRRYDMMKHWRSAGQMSLSQMVNEDGLHLTDLSYRCVARAAAKQIAAILKVPSTPVQVAKLF